MPLVVRLNRMLDWQAQRVRRWDEYFHGRQPLALLPENIRRETFGRLPDIRVNHARLICDAVMERLAVSGFKVADDSVSAELWSTWQRSSCDEGSQLAMLDSLITGRSYAMCWADKDGAPKISFESARHMFVWQMPSLSHRIAALKRWISEDGSAFCTVYTPTKILRYVSESKIALDPWLSPEAVGNPAWGPDAFTFYDFSQLPSTGWKLRGTVKNPLGVVPVVPLVNRPRLDNPSGESEITDAKPIIDAINLLATDMLVSAEYAAMPRRFATGIQFQTRTNPDTGEEEVVDPFSRLKGRVWMSEAPDATFGQFPEASLTNYGEAILNLTQTLGSLAGLPAHYLGIAREPASADAIRSSEAPLVRKVMAKQLQFGGAFEEVMRIADVIRHGLRRPGMDSMETVWADPESRTIAQSADAAGKLQQIGIPLPQLAEDLGYSPQEIQQMPASEVLAGATNGARPPDAPETGREIRRSDEIGNR